MFGVFGCVFVRFFVVEFSRVLMLSVDIVKVIFDRCL